MDLSSPNNVINIRFMFYHCDSLKSIDLSSFNTNNVTNISYLLFACKILESIDLASFNTNNVTNMIGGALIIIL